MEDESYEDLSEEEKDKDKIFPDVYLREAKHKFGYAANAHPYEFKVLLELKEN